MAIALTALLGLIVVVIAVASGNESSARPDVSSSIGRSDVSSTNVPSDNNKNVTATAPPSTLSPNELLEVASLDWMSASESFTGEPAFTEIALVGGSATVAAIPDGGEPVMVFSYDPNSTWQLSATLDIDWGIEALLPDEFRLVDVTDDGSAELFLAYVPYNDYVGVVYQQSNSGDWVEVANEPALEVDADGTLSGVENTCVPYCAEGVTVDFALNWSGSSFRKQYLDDFGNPIDLTITTKCVGDYIPTSGAPMQRCSKGPAVEQLQRALDWAGYLVSVDGSPPTADGFFGPGTETSVRIYQLMVGVPVDGIAQGSWYYDLIETYNAAMGNG